LVTVWRKMGSTSSLMRASPLKLIQINESFRAISFASVTEQSSSEQARDNWVVRRFISFLLWCIRLWHSWEGNSVCAASVTWPVL
jgi:hypothetical protein